MKEMNNMSFEIIEDCSPYFIRYRHTGCDKVIELAKEYKQKFIDTMSYQKKFLHSKMPVEMGTALLEHVYKAKELELTNTRVSLFVTQPDVYYRPHRDGLSLAAGINYNINMKDDLCVTSWYNNEDFTGRPIDNLGGVSREIGDYNRQLEKDLIKPAKSMIAKTGDVVLFNTDIYHDVDNSQSPNERTLLTLRSNLFEKLDFFRAREILFGY